MTETKFLETYDDINESFTEADLAYAIDNFKVVQEVSGPAEDINTAEYTTVVEVKDRFFKIIWDRFYDRFDYTLRRTFYTGDVEEVTPHEITQTIYY